MKEYLYVFFGGGVGSVLRFLISRYANPLFQLPLGTLFCNSFASLLVGIFTVVVARRLQWSEDIFHIFVIGFCGGLSTFSSFSGETIRLFDHNMPLSAILNVCLNVVICMGSVWVGQKIAHHYV
jgi:CrcB protein